MIPTMEGARSAGFGTEEKGLQARASVTNLSPLGQDQLISPLPGLLATRQKAFPLCSLSPVTQQQRTMYQAHGGCGDVRARVLAMQAAGTFSLGMPSHLGWAGVLCCQGANSPPRLVYALNL